MSRLSTRRKEGLHATNSLPSPMISRLGPILRSSVGGSGTAGGSRTGGLQAPTSTLGGSGHGSSLGLPGVGGSGNIGHDADVDSVDSDRLAAMTKSREQLLTATDFQRLLIWRVCLKDLLTGLRTRRVYPQSGCTHLCKKRSHVDYVQNVCMKTPSCSIIAQPPSLFTRRLLFDRF